MRFIISLATLGSIVGASAPVLAKDLTATIELPRFSVAEYHKPYVAAWLSHPNHSVAANLAVWYQQSDGPEGEGQSWLKDIRQWWRRSGRRLELPIDGVTGATRAPGTHKIEFSDSNGPLKDLKEGDYILNVEVAREVGGREIMRIPFTWKKDLEVNETVSGEAELGAITLNITKE